MIFELFVLFIPSGYLWSGLVDGLHNVTITSPVAAGNVGKSTHLFTVDTTTLTLDVINCPFLSSLILLCSFAAITKATNNKLNSRN